MKGQLGDYMSGLKIAHEGVESLWRGLASELDILAPSECVSHFPAERFAHDFCRVGFDGCHDIFEVVTVPTRRAGKTASSFGSVGPSTPTWHLPQRIFMV